MIIFSYLIREALKSQLAVLFVLLSIFMSQEFVKILADAADGDFPGALVATLLALNLPKLAGLILPLSLYLGVLMAHSRMYADSEMTVMHATGMSEWYVTRVTLVLSFIMMLIAGLNSIWLGPWALEREYQVIEQAQAEAGLSSLIPGRFQNSSNKKAVIYVESIDDGKLDKVFVAQLPTTDSPQERTSVVMAREGKIIEEESGSQQMELAAGSRYQGIPGEAEYSAIAFDRYQMQIKEQEIEQRRRKLSAIPIQELWQQDTLDAAAEIQWRIAVPLSVPLLTLLAVPLARVNPRQGKFAKLFPAILLFLGYYVMLMAGRSGIEDEVVPVEVGLWWIHLSALLLGLSLLAKEREIGVKIRAMFRRNGNGKTKAGAV